LYRVGSTVPLRPGSKPRWARHLRQLEVDYIVLDLGSGTQPSTLDLFLLADIGLCVTSPEPPSVETTYRFTRALFLRMLRRMFIADRFKMRLCERAQMELGALPSPQELVRALARYDTNMATLAATELASLHPRLVVNSARLRTDMDLGPAMCDMAVRYLGVAFDYVGHIEQDDSVWLSVVRRRPMLIDSPTSKSARNLERIARRVLALFAARDSKQSDVPMPLVPREPNLYDLLWTHRGATDEDVRRAYKRQRDIYQTGSLPLSSLLSDEQLKSEQARIEEAHDTLLDPIRRKAYDASTFPDEAEPRPKQPSVPDTALQAERDLLRQELAREINAETEFTGALLRKVRESLGIDIDDIAKHTKISTAHLKAIELEAFGELPALVYTRGFVQEVAKYLKLDVAQVTRTYLRRFRAARATSEGDTNP
ncbi:MAG TPA: helix-turn-helix domain-containing protein, partial [Polyangiaceae bacterium]|nr:helix-turn-helix domain-containing protein [Polyangiaceae bacterium]